MKYVESSRKSCWGESLFTVKYLPIQKPKAALCFHHGLCEHVGRYSHIFTKMAESGIAVYSGDARGHGKSEGADRAYFESLDGLITDFEDLCTRAREDCSEQYGGDVPFFIGGHSLGGMIAPLTCLKDQSTWSGLLLCSPCLDVEWTMTLRVQAALSKFFSAAMPKTRMVPKIEASHMNKDPAKVKEYEEDQLNYIGRLPVRTAEQTMKGFKALSAMQSQFTLPIYAHHGTSDRVTIFNATKSFMDGVSSTDKTFHQVQGGYHEVLFEENADQVLQTMIDWILEHAVIGAKM